MHYIAIQIIILDFDIYKYIYGELFCADLI